MSLKEHDNQLGGIYLMDLDQESVNGLMAQVLLVGHGLVPC